MVKKKEEVLTEIVFELHTSGGSFEFEMKVDLDGNSKEEYLKDRFINIANKEGNNLITFRNRKGQSQFIFSNHMVGFGGVK